jgi:membrane protein
MDTFCRSAMSRSNHTPSPHEIGRDGFPDGGYGKADGMSSDLPVDGASTSDLEERAPLPQPERHEPRIADPGLFDLSGRDAVAAGKRAVREAIDDDLTAWAGSIAYALFLALPATLLVSLGLFGVLAGREAVDDLMSKLSTVAPEEAVTLLDRALTRVIENQRGSVILIVVGAVIALWSATGAMNALMTALNRVYEQEETRSFLRRRLTGLLMVGLGMVAFGLVVGLLVLGPHLSGWVGDATGLESFVSWVWWAAQWPVLIAGLFGVFAVMLYLGPNVAHRKLSFITPGSTLAVLMWLVSSGLFALYAGWFGSYEKTWGALAGVVVLLIWLWLSALAVLLGAELNSEIERSRQLRAGTSPSGELRMPTQGS